MDAQELELLLPLQWRLERISNTVLCLATCRPLTLFLLMNFFQVTPLALSTIRLSSSARRLDRPHSIQFALLRPLFRAQEADVFSCSRMLYSQIMQQKSKLFKGCPQSKSGFFSKRNTPSYLSLYSRNVFWPVNVTDLSDRKTKSSVENILFDCCCSRICILQRLSFLACFLSKDGSDFWWILMIAH